MPEEDEFEASCKIRYRHQPVPCRVVLLPEGSCRVLFHEPLKAVTPGQSMVFYRHGEVLGGGMISATMGGWRGVVPSPAVHHGYFRSDPADFAPVADLDHPDGQVIVLNGIDDAVCALANTVSLLTGEFFAPGRTGGINLSRD